MIDMNVVLQVDVDNVRNRIDAVLRIKNLSKKKVYIDQRFVPRAQSLAGEWLGIVCDGKQVIYYGNMYNFGRAGVYFEINPGEEIVSYKVDVTRDYFFPAGFHHCVAFIVPWVTSDPDVVTKGRGEVKYYNFESNRVYFNMTGDNYKERFLNLHKELTRKENK